MAPIEPLRLPLLPPRARQSLPEITVEEISTPIEVQDAPVQTVYAVPLISDVEPLAAESEIIHSQFVESPIEDPRINAYVTSSEFSSHSRSWSA